MNARKPLMTVARMPSAGADFYKLISDGLLGGEPCPEGMMFHFAGSAEDDFFAVSAYRDRESAERVFAELASPAVDDAVAVLGGVSDIAIHEFDIVSCALRAGGEYEFRFVPPGELHAAYITDMRFTRERYRRTIEAVGMFERMPDGLLIHVAGEIGGKWGVFDVWRADADAAAFYAERVQPAVAAQFPDPSEAPAVIATRTIILSAILVNPAFDGPAHDFVGAG